MLYLKNKNLRQRKSYLKKEISLKSKKFVFINLLNNPNVNKKKVIFSFLKRNKNSQTKLKTRLKNRCLATNTSRSVNRSFKLSRIYLKNLLSFGLIPGHKKAVW